MTWQDYKLIKRYKNLAIGLLNGVQVFERKIQSGMASDFYKITAEEFDTFDDWCMKDEEVMKIRLRKVWMRGFFGYAEFRLMDA